MGFRFSPHKMLAEIVVVQSDEHRDARGTFIETFRRSAFIAAGIDVDTMQCNESFSRRGTLRGLHYQRMPAAQGKLVRCVAGRIYDVAVDVRRGSPTFARFADVILVGGSGTMVWIPPGFAHGFLALTDEAIVSYAATAEYRPELERAVRWNDPSLAIPWPLDAPPLLSQKDRDAPLLVDADLESTPDLHR
jgi:dTDP-4-dehydrorhamnose 3,5-epimerase